jgi:hypothetical protein
MIIEHEWDSIISSNIGNDTNMPQVIGWELFKNNNISWLPFLEDVEIIRDDGIRENFRRSREVYLQSLHAPIIDIRIEISLI